MQTNDPRQRTVKLICKARTLIPLQITPPMVNFGRIARNAEEQTKTIVITRGDGDPIKPELEPLKDQQFSAELNEIEPGEKYELVVTVKPPWGNDRLRGRLTLKTGLPQSPEETIRLHGNIDPRLKVVPRGYSIPRAIDADSEFKVQLHWTGEAGNVVDVKVSDPALSARFEEQEGRQYVILSVPAGYKRKAGRASYVTIKTDDEIVPQMRISISEKRKPRQSPRVQSTKTKDAKMGEGPPTTGGERVKRTLIKPAADTQPTR